MSNYHNIPTRKPQNMSFQDFVKSTLDYMFKHNLLCKDELNNLQNREYCRRTFYLDFPLLESNERKIRDRSNICRYWARHKFNNEFYGCSQWWRQNFHIYEPLFEEWIKKVLNHNHVNKNFQELTRTYLDGIFWSERPDFFIPNMETKENAVFAFKKNIASITWNYMSSLEHNPTTLPQTETILKGQSVGGISIDQLMQVKNYGDGSKKLAELILQGQFSLTKEVACLLHSYVGKEEALEWGVFRHSEVSIGGVSYSPPHFSKLFNLANQGFSFISKNCAPAEAALAAFLFMARSQFFYDANKRTASLMMNGILMNNGLHPITLLNKDSEYFHCCLSTFYETGDATNLMSLFAKNVKTLFPNPHDFELAKSNSDSPILTVKD